MASTLSVGEALRSARKARGLSLNDVAKEAGISTATLSRIETEKQNLDVALFLSLSHVLNVSAGAILDRRNGGETEDSLAQTLAAMSADGRARVISAATQRRPARRSPEELQARVDGLLATIDLVRNELSELQTQIRGRRR